MPRLEPLDVVGHVAIVGVLAEERLKAEVLAADGLIPIDPAVLSRAMPETAAAAEPGRPALRPIAAYYAPQADFRLAAQFDAPPPEMAVTANTLLTVGDDGCQVRGGLAMVPEVEKRFTFDLSVPPGWTVVNVTGPEEKPLAFERHTGQGKPGRVPRPPGRGHCRRQGVPRVLPCRLHPARLAGQVEVEPVPGRIPAVRRDGGVARRGGHRRGGPRRPDGPPPVARPARAAGRIGEGEVRPGRGRDESGVSLRDAATRGDDPRRAPPSRA